MQNIYKTTNFATKIMRKYKIQAKKVANYLKIYYNIQWVFYFKQKQYENIQKNICNINYY